MTLLKYSVAFLYIEHLRFGGGKLLHFGGATAPIATPKIANAFCVVCPTPRYTIG